MRQEMEGETTDSFMQVKQQLLRIRRERQRRDKLSIRRGSNSQQQSGAKEERGQVHHLEGSTQGGDTSIEIPFSIERIYYLYDVPAGEARGGHGHKELQQLIVAASGSFDLIVNDGRIKRTIHLARPNMGVYMPAGIWREIDNFSSGSICLVLASKTYGEEDYFRDYNEYLKYKGL